ncbi:MAG: carbon monoxide dehydrogenase accessory protein CooC [Euryarchaeota archaeon]|nr:carbon monoxide dehydrogenase accessory protein CooC [Euryarchaeota archaeon]
MKVAIAGKGGTGKTIVASTLARILARKGFRVIAVDVDPTLNLASSLGIELKEKKPISQMKELIENRTGARPGEGFGGFFKLNPKVDDVLDKFGIAGPDGVKLLLVGTVERGGEGCFCPASAFLRALLRHLVWKEKDMIILDMEAGIEHLGRKTAENVDAFIIMVEPSQKSIEVAKQINQLAQDIGIKKIFAIANKVLSEVDVKNISNSLSAVGIKLIGTIPFDQNITKADAMGKALIDFAPSAPSVQAIEEISIKLAG